MPPAERRTRAIFLEYHQRIRPGAANAQFLREWGAKNGNEKRLWRDAYVEVEKQDRIVRQYQLARDNALALIRNIPTAQNPNVDAYRDACDIVTQTYRRLRPLYLGLERLWLALLQLERFQPGVSMMSQLHAHNSAQTARIEADSTERNIDAVRYDRNRPPVPQDAHGQRRMPARWFIGRAEELLRARTLQHGIDADAEDGNVGLLGQHGTWHAVRRFQGGQSTGYLWVLTHPENGRCIDRVFRKDVQLSEGSWLYPACWDGDMRNPNAKIPNELSCHSAAMNVIGAKNVVRLRGDVHRGLIVNDSCTYRIYTEWSQHRDLHELISHYRERAQVNATAHIPEPMVWYIAEALADCGHAMELGLISPPPGFDWSTLRLSWKQIVHRDLKPANVFLGAPDPDRYNLYPAPMLGDFGLAFKTTISDPNNPRWYNNGMGTEGFMAPEQLRYIDAGTHRPLDEWKLHSKTNVFGIGVILWCLVTLDTAPRQPVWLHRGEDDTTLGLDPATHPSVGRYSLPLRELIERCLSFRPNDRPTFREMLDVVLRETQEGPGGPNRARGMRSGRAGQDVQAREATWLFPNTYCLGLSRAALDRLMG